LLCFGIYSSAISLSNTIVLRNKIRLLTQKNSNLFNSIGEAQVTSQLKNAVKAVKTIVEQEEEKLKEKTGLEVNFTEDKVQDYMQQVVQEILKVNHFLKKHHDIFFKSLMNKFYGLY
jgi:Tfp pilus assembly PilM family ATPase